MRHATSNLHVYRFCAFCVICVFYNLPFFLKPQPPQIIATFLIEQNGLAKRFRLTDEAPTQSYHALQNVSLFVHFQPVKVPRGVLSHCLLRNLEDKYFNYQCGGVNGYNEWNPGKLGWLKSDAGDNEVLRPSVATLSRYFQVHRLSCGTLEATFHGVLNVTNLEQHGKFISRLP